MPIPDPPVDPVTFTVPMPVAEPAPAAAPAPPEPDPVVAAAPEATEPESAPAAGDPAAVGRVAVYVNTSGQARSWLALTDEATGRTLHLAPGEKAESLTPVGFTDPYLKPIEGEE